VLHVTPFSIISRAGNKTTSTERLNGSSEGLKEQQQQKNQEKNDQITLDRTVGKRSAALQSAQATCRERERSWNGNGGGEKT